MRLAGPLAETIERARLIFKRLILEESSDRSADWLEIQKLLGSFDACPELRRERRRRRTDR